ncbi:MAG TPA: hypothetical protein VMH02_03185 [Verrucomicrobiae bacterium]|nr:hypothetical protein [Verrucomicrobiae bacterium]
MLSVVLLLAAAATPTPVPIAQTPGSNVTVSICHAQLDKPPLKIGYTNLAPRPATEVDFTVVGTAGIIQTVKDVGRFATGTQIIHVFRLPYGTTPLGLSSARCVVTKIVYADGTSWVNPNPP